MVIINFTDRFSAGSKAPEVINVLIEASGGSRNRYKFSAKGHLLLDYTLPFSLPFDYGIIPKTLREEEKPLRCMILGSEPVPPKTIVRAKPIALLRVIEGNAYHYHIIATRLNDMKAPRLTPTVKERVEKFFRDYEHLTSKKVKIHWESAELAKKAVGHCMRIYEKLNPTVAAYREV